MNVEQVLQIMKLETLPEGSKSSAGKCIALVERSSGGQDYVIANKGGVIVDKKPSAAVRRIVEYYPVVKEKKEKEADLPEEVEEKPEEVEEKKVYVIPAVFERNEAIEFLVSNRMNLIKMQGKTDDELKKLLKVYGR